MVNDEQIFTITICEHSVWCGNVFHDMRLSVMLQVVKALT